MPLISQKDIDTINNALAELSHYTEDTIVYKKYTGTVQGDQVEGTANTPQYDTDLAITSAMVRELTLKEVQDSGGAYEMGDVEFTIRRDTKPSYQDRIEYDGASWKPTEIKKPPLKGVKMWTVIARKE